MRKPILLHYYITNRCNARCVFCDIWKETPKFDAAPADVRDNLRTARRAGCKFVDFTGGEPLLHPDLPEFLTCAKRIGFVTSVTTNCLLFEERAKELNGLVDLLHFSIDADGAELHDRIRGCKSYDCVMRSIDAALSNGLRPDLLYTYTGENIDAVEGVWKLAREKKLILILDPVFALSGRDTVRADVHRKALSFSKRRGVYLNRAHLLLRDMGGNHVRAPVCRAAGSTVVVTPDNYLALPCYHHRCARVKIGGEDGLAGALASPERADALGREGRYAFCEGCHINCYFDPTYQYMGLTDRLFAESMMCKLRYAIDKYIIYHRLWR